MFDIGFLELLLLAIITLFVVGPERMPIVARKVGRFIGGVKRTVSNFQRQIDTEIRLDEMNKRIMEQTKDLQFGNDDAVGKPKQDDPSPASDDHKEKH